MYFVVSEFSVEFVDNCPWEVDADKTLVALQVRKQANHNTKFAPLAIPEEDGTNYKWWHHVVVDADILCKLITAIIDDEWIIPECCANGLNVRKEGSGSSDSFRCLTGPEFRLYLIGGKHGCLILTTLADILSTNRPVAFHMGHGADKWVRVLQNQENITVKMEHVFSTEEMRQNFFKAFSWPYEGTDTSKEIKINPTKTIWTLHVFRRESQDVFGQLKNLFRKPTQ